MADLQVEAVLRDKTKTGLSQLQRQIERAHNRANTLRNKERAAVEKAHTRSNTLISKQSVAVEKAHNRANTIRQKEQIAVEKAHSRANALREQEKAQLDAKHPQDGSLRRGGRWSRGSDGREGAWSVPGVPSLNEPSQGGVRCDSG